MRRYLRMETTIAVVCVAVGFLYVVQGLRMPEGGSLSRGGLGPGALPTLMGVVMAVAGVAYLVEQLRRVPGGAASESAQPRSYAPADLWRRARRSPVFMVLLVSVYLLLVPWVGFFTLTAVLFLVLFAVIDVLTWPLRVAVTVVFLGLAHLLFDQVLGVAFPIGYAGV